MKIYISLLICITASFILGSCNDWLDVKPSTQLDLEELFSSEKGYGEALKGVYTKMSDASLYGRELTWGALDITGGNYKSVSQPAAYAGMRQYRYLHGASNANNDAIALVDGIWEGLYNAIAGVNAILAHIDGDAAIFSADNYEVAKGEAIGLRAFLHFELLRMFADVYDKSRNEEVLPYVVDLSAKVTPMLTGEEVVDLIISQLKEALELLKNDPMRLGTTPSSVLASIPATAANHNIHDWHNRRFHFNYYAAKATLARVYLWKGEKTDALATALEVIAEQEKRFPWVLSANLSTIEAGTATNQDRTFATEHIFALNVTDIENLFAGYLDNMPATGSIRVSRLTSMQDMFSQNDRGTDPRFKYMYYSYNATTPLLSKFYQPVSVLSYFKYRVPLIRISEMYYIAAECSPSWEDGLAYLKSVRANRGMGTSQLTNVTNYETLMAQVFLEYRKEFIGEGQLWFYYKRRQHTSIVNMTSFPGLHAYTFDRPENEDLYGNRNKE